MISLIVVVLAALYAFIAASSLKRAALAFIFLIPFAPRYLAIGIGAQSLPLSLRRIVLVVLVIKIVLMLATNSSRAWKTVGAMKQISPLLWLLALLYLVYFAATVHGNLISGLPYFVEDCLFAFVSVFVALYMLTFDDGFKKIVQAIAVSLAITLGLALIESFLGHPLLSGLGSTDIFTRLRDPLAGRYRNGDYRVMAGFESAILLAEFISIVIWPCITTLHRTAQGRRIWILVPFALIVVLLTGSRAGIAVPAVIMAVGLALIASNRLRAYSQMTFWLFLLIIIPAIGYFFTMQVLLPSLQATGLGSSAEGQSTYFRLLQYVQAWKLIEVRPWLGYGFQQLYSTILPGLQSLDNYYLVILLQGGILALIIDVTIKVYVLLKMFTAYVTTKQKVFLGIFSALLGSSLFDLFSHSAITHPYFYVFAACGLMLLARTRVTSNVRWADQGLYGWGYLKQTGRH